MPTLGNPTGTIDILKKYNFNLHLTKYILYICRVVKQEDNIYRK